MNSNSLIISLFLSLFFFFIISESLTLSIDDIALDESRKSTVNSIDKGQTFNDILKKVDNTIKTYNVNPLFCPSKGFNKQETVPWGYQAMDIGSFPILSSEPIQICILDSGFDEDHPEFKGLNVTYEALTLNSTELKNEPFRDFLLQTDLYKNRSLVLDPTIGKGNQDWVGTGTVSLGILAARKNKIGTRGFFSGGLHIHMVKGIAFSLFSQSQPLLFGADLIGAVQRCEKKKAKIIIINSAIAGGFKPREEKYFNDLYRKNVLVFAPSGNLCPSAKPCQGEIFGYPSSYSRVVSVGGLSTSMKPIFVSAKNRAVDFAAPGTRYLSTVPTSLKSIFMNQAGVGSCVSIKSKKLPFIASGTLALGSRGGYVTAPVATCYLGKSKCAKARNKICLVLSGGGVSLLKKVYSCQVGGAKAAIIVPATNGTNTLISYLGDKPFRNTTIVIPVINMYYTPAQQLYKIARTNSNIKFAISATREAYNLVSGTYVGNVIAAASAALVWRNHPRCLNSEILDTLKRTALDVGSAGVDDFTGSGMPRPVYASAYRSRKPCLAYRK